MIYCHGTRADLKIGDLLSPGYASNFGRRKPASWIY
ncbi:MAG: NAD(+)--rifampin ADP-ribosyltransferase, partial [Hyphomicrobiales bacterium]